MKKLSSIIILLSFALSACSAKGNSSSGSEPKIKTGDTINTTVGSEFKIAVKAHPASGYHWEVAEALDTKIVDYVWKDYLPDNIENPTFSGSDVWRFKANGPGTTTISLGYYLGMTDVASQLLVVTVVVQ